MKVLIVLLSIVVVALAQIGDFSHVVGGGFNKAGFHPAVNLAAYDQINNRYVDVPPARFDNTVYQVAPLGSGFVAVGSFTQVNGIAARGFAYYNGTSWCGFPHLSLLNWNTFDPTALANYQNKSPGNGGVLGGVTSNFFPTTYISSVTTGGAVAVYVSGNYVYLMGVPGTATFNLIGEQLGTGVAGSSSPYTVINGLNYVSYAGLARFMYNGNGNFTLDTSFNQYVTSAGGTQVNPNLNGGGQFVADTLAGLITGATITPNSVKLRVFNPSSGNPTVFAFFGGGTAIPLYWVGGSMASWFNPLVTSAFNTSASNNQPVTVTIQFKPIGAISDCDMDVSNGLIYCVGNFNNTALTQGPAYFHIATFQTLVPATGNQQWNAPTNPLTNINNMVANGFTMGISKITIASAGNYYFTAQYIDPAQGATNNNARYNAFGLWRYFNFNGATTLLGSGNQVSGARFQTDATQLLYVGGSFPVVIAGDGQLYDNYYSQVDISVTKYIKKFSSAITFNTTGNDWTDAFGGFVVGGAAPYLIASNGSITWIYSSGINAAYDIYSAGSLAVYDQNSNIQRWYNMAPLRFTVRGNPPTGTDGTIYTTHWIQSQPSGVTDYVVVAGNFDWYGTQWLGSVAFYHILQYSNPTLSSVGGGLWVQNVLPSINDQDTAVLSAGTVYRVEEANGILYAGGVFSSNVNFGCLSNIAAVNFQVSGAVWYGLGSGCSGAVVDLLYNGGKLYVAGNFDNCGGVAYTRGIAYWDTGLLQWFALGSGLPGASVTGSLPPTGTYAMEWYGGNLYVGGTFSSTPGGLRNGGGSGLYRWTTDHWENVYASCELQCSTTEFEAPIQTKNSGSSFDPTVRAVPSPVTSLRAYQGLLFALAGGNLYAVQGNNGPIYNYGTASRACIKQGCLSRNVTGSNLIIVGANEAGGTYSGIQNYQLFQSGKGNNFISTGYGGFNAPPNFIASSSVLSFSLFLSIVLFFIYLF